MKRFFLYILFFVSIVSTAQITDTLPPVNIFVNHQQKPPFIILSDTLPGSERNLGEFLFYQSPLQLRTYGKGMVSGVSMRGCSPSQILVLWNGIPINSPLNGQTDVNTLPAIGHEKIEIFTGGNSVSFGSGAMGGAVVLNAVPHFQQHPKIKAGLYYGSYGSKIFSGKAGISKNNWNLKTAVRIQSDKNNFSWPEFFYTNHNAQIERKDFSSDLFYKIHKSVFSFHILHSNAERELPGTLYSYSESMLKNKDHKMALKWETDKTGFQAGATAAWLWENYEYYYKKEGNISGRGEAQTFFFKTFADKKWKSFFHTKVELSQRYITGKTLNFDTKKRNITGMVLQLVFNKANIQSQAGLRYITGNFKPNLPTYFFNFSFSKQIFSTGLSFNTHFRLPTFNDLYWNPGGNPQLKPETGEEWEFFTSFNHKHFKIKTQFFFKQTQNLIKWIPGNNQIWHPVNIDRTKGYGVETYTQAGFHVGKIFFQPQWTFSYQKIYNVQTGKILIYTPFFISTLHIPVKFRNFSINYFHRYQSYAYTTPSNTSFLKGYHLHGITLETNLKEMSAGITIDNLFNQYYELIPSRPMPGRTYTLFLKFNFKTNKS